MRGQEMKVYVIECKPWKQHFVVIAATKLQASGLAISSLYRTGVEEHRVGELLDQGWPRPQDITELDTGKRGVMLLE